MVITKHALKRFRERWPSSAAETDDAIKRRLLQQVKQACSRKDLVKTPGGVHYPVSYLGSDGYVVVKNERVTTVLPHSWCAEVNAVRKSKNGF